MSNLYQQLLAHQAAADSKHRHLVEVLCGFLEQLDEDGDLPPDWHDKLMDHITSELTVLPGDRPTPLWRSELFTEEEQDRMVEMMIEEVRDSAKGYAHDMLNGEELIELIGYADNDPEDTCRVLLHWGNAIELEELKASMGAGGVDIEDHVKYALRFALLDERGVTERGREYMSRWL